MNAVLEAAPLWISDNSSLLWGLTIASVVTFVGTLVAVPFLLTAIPADYFLHSPPRQQRGWTVRHPAGRVAVKAGKNALGLVLVTAGISMLVLPGQGLLTILVGTTLLDLPGKRKLEVAILRRRHVSQAVDWLRRQRNRPPLLLPDE